MFAGFDFDVIERSLPYLFKEGMTFTLTLTAMAMAGGIVFGTLLAMARLSSMPLFNVPAAAYVNLAFVGLSAKLMEWLHLEQEPSVWISFVISMGVLALIMRRG